MRAALLAVGLLFIAGCTASPPASEAESASIITDPRDVPGANTGTGHIHDYWNGRDRIVVVEQTFDGPRWSCGGPCAQGMGFAAVRPDEGTVVPQGTAWVNGSFTLAPHPDDRFERLELWVKSAADDALLLWGDLESGVPFAIASSREANDPPHYVLSLWQFEVRAYGAQDVSVGGRMQWSIHAERGLPLEVYPPHPDPWQGATTLPVLEDDGGTSLAYELDVPTGRRIQCTGGCPRTHAPTDGALVPTGADRVEGTLAITSGLPQGLALWYHGADTWSLAQVSLVSTGNGQYGFSIPVTGAMADSPYALQSLWEFRVWMDGPASARAWSGNYTLSIAAFRDA